MRRNDVRAGRMGVAFSRPLHEEWAGLGVAARFSGPDMVARGNCSIRGATRRRHAVTGLLMLSNPHLRGLVGRWVRLGEARAVSGGCGAFGRFVGSI